MGGVDSHCIYRGGNFLNRNILGKNFYHRLDIWNTPKGRNIYPLFLVGM